MDQPRTNGEPTLTPSKASDHPWRERWPRILRVLVGGALLVAIATRIDPSQLTVHWGLAVVRAVASVAGILLVALFVSALRWRLILGDDAPRPAYTYRLYLIANFFSIFLPSSIGGDAVRAIAIAPKVGGRMRGLVGVLLDRIAGVCALFFYLALGLLVARPELHALGRARLALPPWLVRAGTLAVLLVVAAGALVLVRRFARARESVRAGRDMIISLLRSRGRLLGVAAASMIVQGSYIVAWIVLASGFGIQVPWTTFVLCVPLVSLGTMIPVTFSGLGLREGAWILLFAPFGIPKADILVFSLSYFVAFSAVGAVGGMLFLLFGFGDAPAAQPLPDASTQMGEGA